MNSFYTICGVVFLGVFSIGIHAEDKKPENFEDRIMHYAFQELQLCNQFRASIVDTYNKAHRHVEGNFRAQENLGVAKIFLERKNVTSILCSGTHLTPGILVTAATCVVDKNPDDLKAEVTYWDWGTKISVVGVKSTFIAPNFNNKTFENNVAILRIKSEFFWWVNIFFLSLYHISPKLILDNEWKTFQHKWDVHVETEEFNLFAVETNVTLDYKKCDNEPKDYWYCAKVISKGSSCEPALNKMDIGAPFFVTNWNFKTVIGIYTGRNIDGTSLGHMFESLWPNQKWIAQTIVTNIF